MVYPDDFEGPAWPVERGDYEFVWHIRSDRGLVHMGGPLKLKNSLSGR